MICAVVDFLPAVTVCELVSCGTTAFSAVDVPESTDDWSASATLVVRFWQRMPPPAPDRTVRTDVPRELIWSDTAFADPAPTPTSRMTEPTPMSTPRSVSTERMTFELIPRRADLRISSAFMRALLPRAWHQGARPGRPTRSARPASARPDACAPRRPARA